MTEPQKPRKGRLKGGGAPIRSTDVDPTLLLRKGLNDLQIKLLARPLQQLELEADRWNSDQPAAKHGPVAITEFLQQRIKEEVQALRHLDRKLNGFERQSVQSMTQEDRAQLILSTARELGATDRQLKADAKALGRWFDEGAILDRFATQRGNLVRRIVFMLERIGSVSQRAARGTPWMGISPEPIVRALIDEALDDCIITAALSALAQALEAGRLRDDSSRLDDDLLQRVIQLAQDDRENVWVQCRALDVIAAAEGRSEAVRPEVLLAVLEQRLTRRGDDDDLFVRRHAVALGEQLLNSLPQASVIIFFGSRDPSPSVRQRAAAALAAAPAEFALNLWDKLSRDSEPAVRIEAARVAVQLAKREGAATGILPRLSAWLETEEEPLVVRSALRSLFEAYESIAANNEELAREWARWSRSVFERLRTTSPDVQVRREAAAAAERLWMMSHEDARRIAELVKERLPSPGRSTRFGRQEVEAFPGDVWGRTLSVLSQSDHGLELERTALGYRLHRGFRWRFRLWRLLHELRNPAPDKRQAYRHTVGRVHYGQVRAPSRILAELAQTKVPGEPLFAAEEGGWRPYLPLTDDFISILNQPLPGTATEFFTSEGRTIVYPPPTFISRLRAYARLNWKFSEIANLRNWNEGAGSPSRFLDSMKALGFRVEHAEHDDQNDADETLKRHFPAFVLPGGLDLFERFQRYALSLYENSLLDLALFVAAVCAVFFGRHWWNNRKLRQARGEIPLAMGGWGTRGKSSVERLKAALLNAQGHGVVSKTTGCEAMLLLAPSHGDLKEIFLYRPYDKATIWEQANVIRLSAKLRCDALLWECMGLTPHYVDVLQRQWMRDDIATLTNTYPDHEDIQGPAGIDIPKVMTLFIPERSTLLTSEEQMLPILREAAQERGTELRQVDWFDAATIAPDILSRFPYDEHPYNIALLLELADSLGIDRDVALKEMADRVVPDLGVLKTYPRSCVRGRWLRFSNGMSANERHGCLSNWERLGLENMPHPSEEWVTTVVNNRADRIPRSKVFAKILVEDISADRHVLIGGNLPGLQGYIEEALDEALNDLSFQQEGSDPEEIFEREAARRRIPISQEDVDLRLAALCRAVGADRPGDGASLVDRLERAGVSPEVRDEVDHLHRADAQTYAEYDALRDALIADGGVPSENTTGNCKAALRAWFLNTVVAIDDYYATGDEIVERIAAITPPGRENHIIGLQNIKGTGLDFVYRWQAWEQISQALELLRSSDERTQSEGLRKMAGFQELGVLSEHELRSTFESLRDRAIDTEGLFAQLDAIEGRQSNTGDAGASNGTSKHWLSTAIFSALEGLLDAGDAIRRRKTSDRIYEDLANTDQPRTCGSRTQSHHPAAKGRLAAEELRQPSGAGPQCHWSRAEPASQTDAHRGEALAIVFPSPRHFSEPALPMFRRHDKGASDVSRHPRQR